MTSSWFDRPKGQLWRCGAALLAGLATGCGFAPLNLWPLTLIGLAAFIFVLTTARPRQGLGAGFCFGLGLFTLTVSWVHVLGWWIAVALVAFMSCWMLLFGWATTLVLQLPVWPLWVACLWSGFEFGSSRLPFGGFGWTRLAYTTADNPLSGYLPYIGVGGTSWIIALCAAIAVALLNNRRYLAAVLSTAVAFGLGFGLGRLPVPAAESDTVRIGMVQGDVDWSAGSHSMGYARSVTNNHVSETATLLAKVRTGAAATPDFILWPENSTDYDPRTDEVSGYLVTQVSQLAGIPILVGAVTQGPGEDERQTMAIWWDPSAGPTDEVAKRNLVPFGEFTPMKDLIFKLFPIAQQVGRQSVPGTEPGVLHVDLDGAPLAIGNAMCFELAFDPTMYDTVRFGGEVITVQSNNNSYTGTWQPQQQFQITRVRAMELQREIVVATTSSISGLIDASGNVVDRTQEATSASATYEVPRRTNVSWAARIAANLELVLAAIGLAGGVAGGIVSLVRRKRP